MTSRKDKPGPYRRKPLGRVMPALLGHDADEKENLPVEEIRKLESIFSTLKAIVPATNQDQSDFLQKDRTDRLDALKSNEKSKEQALKNIFKYMQEQLVKSLSAAFKISCDTDRSKVEYVQSLLDQVLPGAKVTFAHAAEPEAVFAKAAAPSAAEQPQGQSKPAWKDQKSQYDNPYEFLKAVYPEEIGPGLSWPRIYQLKDTQLYHALKRHAERGKLPEGVHILSRIEVTDRKHAAFDPEQVREAVNLSSAVRKRKWRANRQP